MDRGAPVCVEISVDGAPSGDGVWLPLLTQPGAVSDWQQRQLDLSAFAGFPARLRFVVPDEQVLPVAPIPDVMPAPAPTEADNAPPPPGDLDSAPVDL